MTLFRHPLFAMRDIELDMSAMPAPIKREKYVEIDVLAAEMRKQHPEEMREAEVWVRDALSPTPTDPMEGKHLLGEEYVQEQPGEFRAGDKIMVRDAIGNGDWRPRLYTQGCTLIPYAVHNIRRPSDAELAQHWGDGWIEWHGKGNCPVPPDVLVIVRFGDGESSENARYARVFRWDRRGTSSDIIAYRICNGNT